MSDAVMTRVIKVTVEKLSVSESEVIPSASFQDDLGADSLEVVELVMALEEEFSITIPDDSVQGIKTVQDAYDYIVSQGVSPTGAHS